LAARTKSAQTLRQKAPAFGGPSTDASFLEPKACRQRKVAIYGVRRSVCGALWARALSHPFNEQHIADGQDHRPHKQPEKAVGNHSADDANQNYRHRHFQSATEHQWL